METLKSAHGKRQQQQHAEQNLFFTLQPTHTHSLASFNRYTPIRGINGEVTDSYRLAHIDMHACTVSRHQIQPPWLNCVTSYISFDRQSRAVTPADLWLHADWLGKDWKGHHTITITFLSLFFFLAHSVSLFLITQKKKTTHKRILCRWLRGVSKNRGKGASRGCVDALDDRGVGWHSHTIKKHTHIHAADYTVT